MSETVQPRRRRLDWATSDRPSKITVPERANPFAKLVFREMAAGRITYAELEHRSNVLVSTFKAWRKQTNSPGLFTLEAVLGALGWGLIAVPLNVEGMPEGVRNLVADLGEHFGSNEEIYGAAIRTAAEWPAYAKTKQAETTRLANAAAQEGPAS